MGFLQGLVQGLPAGMEVGMRGSEMNLRQQLMREQRAAQKEAANLQETQMTLQAFQAGPDALEFFGAKRGYKSPEFKQLLASAKSEDESERQFAVDYLNMATQEGLEVNKLLKGEYSAEQTMKLAELVMTKRKEQQDQENEDRRILVQERKLGVDQAQERRLAQQAQYEQTLGQAILGIGGGGGGVIPAGGTDFSSNLEGLMADPQAQAALAFLAPKLFDNLMDTPFAAGAAEGAKEKAKADYQLNQRVPNDFATITGLPKGTPAKVAQELGYNVEALANPKDRREIAQSRADVQNMTREVQGIRELVQREGADILGPSGALSRGLGSAIEQFQSLAGKLGVPISKVTLGDVRKGLKNSIGDAENASIYQSKMLGLARTLAKAVEDDRLSNQDVESYIQQLAGNSGNANAILSTLGELENRLVSSQQERYQASVGMPPLSDIPVEQFQQVLQNENVSDQTLAVIAKELERRGISF